MGIFSRSDNSGNGMFSRRESNWLGWENDAAKKERERGVRLRARAAQEQAARRDKQRKRDAATAIRKANAAKKKAAEKRTRQWERKNQVKKGWFS